MIIGKSAFFSHCRKYRYWLYRCWDEQLPAVLFIGLNPSTANESDDDPTIKRVCRIAKFNGYGSVYMMNCFPYVSTDPKKLHEGFDVNTKCLNDILLIEKAALCRDVVFAWGNFKEVSVDIIEFLKMTFPDAKALYINKNGSPKHPLYCPIESKFVDFIKKAI